jgi:glutamate synthase domain-containing protein 1
LLVHNGIFENFQEIKDRLLRKKIKFKGETDSEVMSNWVASVMMDENFDLFQLDAPDRNVFRVGIYESTDLSNLEHYERAFDMVVVNEKIDFREINQILF